MGVPNNPFNPIARKKRSGLTAALGIERPYMNQEKLIEVWKALESIVVSLDRIGSYEADRGQDAAKDALYEYFHSGIFRNVATARTNVVNLIEAFDAGAKDRLEALAEDGVSVHCWQPPGTHA
jgi:hypothetical protein